jgi:uncharacterized protein with HEPN domain
MLDRELVREVLSQILIACKRIVRRFEPLREPDDFLSSDAGLDRLDAIGMMLIAIGESAKYLDRITDKMLLIQYPQVDWSGAWEYAIC